MSSVTTDLDPRINPSEPFPPGLADRPVEPDQWFDRSSITADVMVTIEGVSEEDWWRYAPEGRVCEYWDGVVYMPSPASIEHQDDVGFLFFLLSGYATRTRAGHVVLGPGVLRLAPRRNPEPDVFVLPTGVGPHASPALLVVETLSPSTRAHDLGRKAQGFREARIPEIVHVDLHRKRLIVSRLAEDLYTTEVVEPRDLAFERPVPGFWVDTAWLWAELLPDRLDCLMAILAGPRPEPRMLDIDDLIRRAWPLFREAVRMGRRITYTELAARVGPPLTRRHVHRQFLIFLGERCRKAGLPDLCALVVRKDTGKPGGGWHGPTPSADPDRAWAEALAECLGYAWKTHPDPRLLGMGPDRDV